MRAAGDYCSNTKQSNHPDGVNWNKAGPRLRTEFRDDRTKLVGLFNLPERCSGTYEGNRDESRRKKHGESFHAEDDKPAGVQVKTIPGHKPVECSRAGSFFLLPGRFDFFAAGCMLLRVEREFMSYISNSLLLLLTRVISAGS